MRVSLPNRPGSLGAVASALGAIEVDIHAIEIVERTGETYINDFLVRSTPGRLIDSIVAACHRIPGVSVTWISRFPSGGKLQSDLETLESMTRDPSHAAEILVNAVPIVFRAHWVLLIDLLTRPTVARGTEMAPEPDEEALAQLGPFHTLHRAELPEGWLRGWVSATAVIAPMARQQALVVGRQGGPPFLDSELARIGHIAALA